MSIEITSAERIKLALETLREIERAVSRSTPTLDDPTLERRIANVVRLYCAGLIVDKAG